MANLVKPIIVRWLDTDGNRVPANTPGASKVRERAKKWYGQNVPGWPKGKRVPLATLKATAQMLLNRLVEDAIRGNAGLADRYREHNARPVADHLDAYRRELQARGATSKHVGQTCDMIAALCRGCKFKALLEIDAEGVINWLADLRQDRHPRTLPDGKTDFSPAEVAALLGVTTQAVWLQSRRANLAAKGNGKARRYPRAAVEALLARGARGASVQTSNYYLAAFQAFCRWLVDDKRMSANPIARLRGADPNLDRRHNRRELAIDELLRILESTRSSRRTFRGLTGEDRFHVYLTACGTGFRAGELAALTPGSFLLDADPPAVRLPRRNEKARRGTTQPLPSGVALALRDYLRGRQSDAPLWPGRWAKNGADMLRIDLEAAGVSYETPGPDGPLFADFHALRHSFITLMARSGVSPKEAQQLARHADIRLTMDRYTHLGLADLATAVGRLPALTVSSTSANVDAVSIPAADFHTLTALAALALALLTPDPDTGCSLVAPRVALDFAPVGDGLGRSEINYRADDEG